jgi:hypothetical protein
MWLHSFPFASCNVVEHPARRAGKFAFFSISKWRAIQTEQDPPALSQLDSTTYLPALVPPPCDWSVIRILTQRMDTASGRKPRPPEVDRFAKAFQLAGEDQEIAGDEATSDLLGTFLTILTLKRRKLNLRKLKRLKSNSTRILTELTSLGTSLRRR